ncbi:MAG: dTDP-4-dehydrorhamnose 3,5-epimerase [Pseudomonadota bacterium]
MQIEHTSLDGVVVLTPKKFGDDRGWFSETWNANRMAELGLNIHFLQDNHSMSAKAGTLRGLHYQSPPHAQDKLVRCTRGSIFDVAVDIRVGSPTYGKWFGIELSLENGKQLLVPRGFLHGFVTRMSDTEVQYKCSDVYAPDCDGGIRWDDPTIGIDWGLTEVPTLSAKDQVAPLLNDFKSPFLWEKA